MGKNKNKQNEQNENLNYFNYLKICHSKGQHIIRYNENLNNIAILGEYYSNYGYFRRIICEHIYDGINMFPGISRFIISCSNSTGTTRIVIGLFDELADDKFNCLMKIEDKDTDEVLTLNRSDIKNLYTFNRSLHSEIYDVNIFMAMLIRGGGIPKIFTHQIYLKNVVYNKDGSF